MHKPRHSLGLLAALLSGKAFDDAYRPKVPGLPVWSGQPRDSNRGHVGVYDLRARDFSLSRRDWRAATKADRRRAKDRSQRAAKERGAWVVSRARLLIALASIAGCNSRPAQAAVATPSDTVVAIRAGEKIPGRYLGMSQGVEVWDMGDFTVRVRRVQP